MTPATSAWTGLTLTTTDGGSEPKANPLVKTTMIRIEMNIFLTRSLPEELIDGVFCNVIIYHS
jgi:hypothetical protein